jgi:hypothetical protein
MDWPLVKKKTFNTQEFPMVRERNINFSQMIWYIKKNPKPYLKVSTKFLNKKITDLKVLKNNEPHNFDCYTCS